MFFDLELDEMKECYFGNCPHEKKQSNDIDSCIKNTLPVFLVKPLCVQALGRLHQVCDKIFLQEVFFFVACSKLRLRCLCILYYASQVNKVQVRPKSKKHEHKLCPGKTMTSWCPKAGSQIIIQVEKITQKNNTKNYTIYMPLQRGIETTGFQ